MAMDRRLVIGVIFAVVFMFILIVFYSVMIWPMEHITNSLNTAYQGVSTEMGWTDASTVRNGLLFILWAFVGCIVVGFICLFIYLYALAHRNEYDQGYQ